MYIYIQPHQEGDKSSSSVSYYVPSMLQRQMSETDQSQFNDMSMFFVDFDGFLPGNCE